MRSSFAGYVLWCLGFAGFCGVHRLYAGKHVTGLLWLFTFGLGFVGQIVDLVLIPGMVERANLHDELAQIRRFDHYWANRRGYARV